MSTDQKIDEILELVKSEQELNSKRFEAVDRRFEAVDRRFEVVDRRFDEVLDVIKSEREIGNARFSQVSSGLAELNKKVDTMGVELKQEINQVYTSLSEDIQVFGEDLDKVKKRLTKVERKIA